MFQDLRYGMRMLLKHNGFALVAVLSLAIGIGANRALFSVVDALMLRRLPVNEPGRLVLFEWEAGQARGRRKAAPASFDQSHARSTLFKIIRRMILK